VVRAIKPADKVYAPAENSGCCGLAWRAERGKGLPPLLGMRNIKPFDGGKRLPAIRAPHDVHISPESYSYVLSVQARVD